MLKLRSLHQRLGASGLALAAVLLPLGVAQADTWTTSTAGIIRPSGTGTKVGLGISGTTVTNRLDVKGGAAIGSWTTTGAPVAPTNGLVVSGNVLIGTSPSTSDKLSVSGNIKATGTITADGGIKVKTWSMEVPDYVFDRQGHRLAPLAEVESYVNAHKHLPEIPSATQLQRQGMDLAQMNLLLLKKVEELTLYAIEQDKKLAALSARLDR
jgi:hypothetical protein